MRPATTPATRAAAAPRRSRVAVSLALPDTDACLHVLQALVPRIGLAEVRLDRMRSFDLARLVAQAPCPLVATCRPPREGGAFAGSEAERLGVLREALRVGCAFVDVEWDSLDALPRPSRGTRLIASRHVFDGMPASWLADDVRLRRQADAVKLVGLARRAGDVLPVLELLHHAGGPVVAIAMGAEGRATRLLAPAYPACLLTYAAVDAAAATAPGQLGVDEMVGLYALDQVGAHTRVHVHLAADAASAAAVTHANAAGRGTCLHVPIEATPEEAHVLAAALPRCVPRLTLSADAALGVALPAQAPAVHASADAGGRP